MSVNSKGDDALRIARRCLRKPDKFVESSTLFIANSRQNHVQEVVQVVNPRPSHVPSVQFRHFLSFSISFPKEFDIIKDHLNVSPFNVNVQVQGVSLYCFCIEKLMSSLASPESLIPLTSFFIQHRVDFNRRNTFGNTFSNTCLHRAIAWFWIHPSYQPTVCEIIRVMIFNGADVCLENHHGNDALKLLFEPCYPFFMFENVFGAAGPRQLYVLTSRNRYGITAIEMARRVNPPVAQYLDMKYSQINYFYNAITRGRTLLANPYRVSER